MWVDFLEWVQSVMLYLLDKGVEGDTLISQSYLFLPDRFMKKVVLGQGWRLHGELNNVNFSPAKLI